MSPNDRHPDVHAKVLDWLDAGARQVWLVDPRTRTVTVFLPDRTAVVLRDDQQLTGGEVLPGFACPVAGFFEE